jgi:PAS domain S-box-containing protein
MWVFDQESLAFLAVNARAIRRYGYSSEEFAAMTILDIRPAEDISALVKETLDPARRGPSNREEWRHKMKDGTVFPVEITSWELIFKGRKAELVRAVPIAERCEAIHEGTQVTTSGEQEKRDC